MTFRPWVFLPFTKIFFHTLWSVEQGICPTKPPGILLVPEASYSFILYFLDPVWEKKKDFHLFGKVKWSSFKAVWLVVFGYCFYKLGFPWDLATYSFLQIHFLMIFIFSIIVGLQCSVSFLLYSKVTQSHIHAYTFSHIILHHAPS